MSILKFIIVGAAVGLGVYYVTRENEDGKSIFDDLVEDAPDYFDRAKKYVELTVDQITERLHAK